VRDWPSVRNTTLAGTCSDNPKDSSRMPPPVAAESDVFPPAPAPPFRYPAKASLARSVRAEIHKARGPDGESSPSPTDNLVHGPDSEV
jgi:hypothetical protein